jgi:ABC-type transport system involved in multi-copper enzyme maturation permease subunit
LSRTWTLAENTFREAVRDRMLVACLVFGAMVLGGAVALAPLTLGEGGRIIADLGLAAISVFSFLILVLVGTGLVYKEIERRTIMTILTHPVHRHEFVLGKYLGLLGTLLLCLAMLSVLYLGIVQVFGNGVGLNHVAALLLTALEIMLATAVALFFATVASPILSAVFTCSTVVLGFLSDDLRSLALANGTPLLQGIAKAAYVVLPAFHQFNIRNNLLSGVPVPIEYVASCIAYALLDTAAILLVTIAVFSKRDFQ